MNANRKRYFKMLTVAGYGSALYLLVIVVVVNTILTFDYYNEKLLDEWKRREFTLRCNLRNFELMRCEFDKIMGCQEAVNDTENEIDSENDTDYAINETVNGAVNDADNEIAERLMVLFKEGSEYASFREKIERILILDDSLFRLMNRI